MKKKRAALFFSTIATIVVFSMLQFKLGQLPGLGNFLNPFTGIWQNALIPDIPASSTIKLNGLNSEVKIIFNDRAVPHIFADNLQDLYFATGYVMAMHRLWQMEFTTHASLGRISEIVGEDAVGYDRYMRRMGMTYGAEQMMEAAMEDEAVMLALNAFSDGVNAWISGLKPSQYPFEYKLMGYEPEMWTPMKSLSLGMSISRTLSGGSNAVFMTYLKAAWGKEAVLKLFASLPDDLEPIITPETRFVPTMEVPNGPGNKFIPSFIFDELIGGIESGIGSNNWAVSGSRSESGSPLFATDPHLGLTLPSIWYEMQLNAPGINTYGVTFPGVPAIIMGFNERIAWGKTNTGNMVLDILEIETNNEFTHYLYEGEWLPLTFRLEEIKVRNGAVILDSIAFTHHGPLMYRSSEIPFTSRFPVSHALAWTAHSSGNVFNALMGLNTAGDIDEFRNSLSGLQSPPQSYAFASVSGDIAMQLNGLWPLRWQHQGMFIGDGRDRAYSWHDHIPFEELPHEINPERGFVSSANQHPVDETYPYYHGWYFAGTARASVINRTLESMQDATPTDMKRLQLDDSDFWAEQHLDNMIDSLLKYREGKEPNGFAELSAVLRVLGEWNKRNEPRSIAATIFDQWRHELRNSLWRPLFEPLTGQSPVYPSWDITFQVLFHQKPVDTYVDLFGSLPPTGQLLMKGLERAVTRTGFVLHGDNNGLQWYKHNGAVINHLLNIPALNHARLRVGGSADSPNAIRNSHGPSWRMVAHMKEDPEVWGIYPGGQAANPATRGYDAFVEDWARGNYYPVSLYKNSEEARRNNNNVLTIIPAAR